MISQNLEVIGINTLTSVNEQGISFALPINLACDINGVSSSIGTEPSSCPTYEAPQEKMDKVSLSRAPNGSRGGSTGASDIYRREAEELKERLAKEEQEIVEKNQTLQNKANEIVSQANADPLNQSLKERAASEIAELKAKSLALQKEQAEARLRYLSGVIGILERQSLDSAFSSIRPQIDSQMEQLRASREKLLDFLKQ
jgi:hypothetical protein